MIRFVFPTTLALLGLIVSPAVAGELSIGDPAPALDIADWVKGEPVDLNKSKGKQVVVVEFWATWCGPCIEIMPHLSELQHKYRGKGLAVVSITSEDPNNTLKIVKAFVKKQGDKMAYSVAFDDGEKTSRAYMEASGQTGIPTAYLVDKQGRIAWIGDPRSGMDEAIEELLDDKYDIELAGKKFELEQRGRQAMLYGEWEKFLKVADEVIALEPAELRPWQGKLWVYTTQLNQPENALHTAKLAIKAFDNKPNELAELATMLVVGESDEAVEAYGSRVIVKQFNMAAEQAIVRAAELSPDDGNVYAGKYMVLATLGKEAEALVVAERAINLMKGDPSTLARFSRLLSTPDPKNRCNDLALSAVDMAIAAEPDNPDHLRSKFIILATCKQDIKAATKLGYYVVEKAADDATLLNALSWELLTEEPFVGKFDKLALAAAERCHVVSGGANWMFIDTLALAKFKDGQVEEAIELETKALKICDNAGAKASLREALEHFEKGKK